MKYALIIISVFLTIICASCSSEKEYTNYVPLIFDGNTLVKEEKLLTKKHFDNIEYVLNFYEVHYERNGKIKIKFNKPLNEELMWNYTTKAESEKWFKWNGPKNKKI